MVYAADSNPAEATRGGSTPLTCTSLSDGMADIADLNPAAERRAGSTPALGTMTYNEKAMLIVGLSAGSTIGMIVTLIITTLI